MSAHDSYSNYVDIKGRAGRTVYVPPDMGEIMFLVRTRKCTVADDRMLSDWVPRVGAHTMVPQQGCNVGDEPITLRCGRCGYNGPSTVKKERGPANIVTTVATLGIVRKKALETVHGCPGCNKNVAYSKPF